MDLRKIVIALLFFVLCSIPLSTVTYAYDFDSVGSNSNADDGIMTLDENYGIMSVAAALPISYTKLARMDDTNIPFSGSSVSGVMNRTCAYFYANTTENFLFQYSFTSSRTVDNFVMSYKIDDTWISVSLPNQFIIRSGNKYTIKMIFKPMGNLQDFELWAYYNDAALTTVTFGDMYRVDNYFVSSNYAELSGVYTSSGAHYTVQSLRYYYYNDGSMDSLGLIPNTGTMLKRHNDGKFNVYWTLGGSGGKYMGGYQYVAYFDIWNLEIFSNVCLFDGTSYLTPDSWSYKDGRLVITFTPLYDIDTTDLYFALDYWNQAGAYRISCVNITSSYIPAGNTDDINQSVNSNTTIIKNITTTISNTVSNISNTVSNISTNIVKKADEIKSTVTTGLSNLGNSVNNKLQDVKQGVTDKLQDVKSGITTKLDDVKSGITNKLDQTTDKITEGYDSSAMDASNDKLNNSLNEYGDAESNVLDKVNDSLENFEFSNSAENYVSTFQVCSGFIQSLYENSGGFKDVINIAFMLCIASLIIGIYRFKGD